MKRSLWFGAAAVLLSFSLWAADSGPKDEVQKAAKALGDKPNYSWTTTVKVPEGSRFRPGPTEGKTEKDGFTQITMKFGDNTTEAVFKGEKAAASDPDGGWQSLSDLENAEGPRQFLGMMLRNFKNPAAQAAQVASFTKELKKEGDVYAGDLTEDGAKTLLTWRPRNGDGPSVTEPKGTAKFWVKDGALTKYEFHVKGKVSFNGNDFDSDRTTTVEIKDVGTTKVSVPEDAKKKLS